MSSVAVDLDKVFQEAHDGGDLSMASMNILTGLDIGAQIQAGLGVAADDVEASEVVLITQEIDDSSSINFVAGNKQAVMDGSNEVLDSVGQSKQSDSILCSTCYLNDGILYPYRHLSDAVRLDGKNYNPSGTTPLNSRTIITLGTVLAKYFEFADNGVPARTITLIVTDGGNNDNTPASKVRDVVEDMLKQEMHIIAGMGIDDGSTDFKQVFKEMGIPDEWILTPANDPSEIRKAFQVFSQSAVRASQGGASFSQTALGGFAN